ncbi:Protein of unknown function [Pseudomonas sp. ok272]|uniref:DUF1120 domain-containing protein n=1 Tax=unclassified Pseudomonas TaxID=196821 RepID=UPI0008B5FE48|nr:MULTISPECIES: DUF1120 domain-containing protein [unclassified Pseudomonas]SEM32310.1 Protein of unknown function [Pseudomonas sp. ok272]SFM32244.1 Protein of unknown function [Pseudomonas sp. ok602]
MNKLYPTLATALLLTCAPSAFAASTVDLTITGKITPSACTPTLPNAGVIDYGKISAKDLNQAANTYLGKRKVPLAVTCEAKTLLALGLTDNRAGTSSYQPAVTYGLGLINESEKLGFYYMSFMNPVADADQPSTLLHSTNSGTTWRELFDDDSVLPNYWIALGHFDISTGWAPHPLQNLTVDIEVNPGIAPANSLTLNNEVTLDGSTTVEVLYL